MRRILWCLIGLSAVSLVGVPAQANPDHVTVQSALVWRADGTGDYLLPELSPETTYELPEGVYTPGHIEALTATWSFSGEVTLELSADGGLHYTPALHGVPLTEGFVRGNRIKWRAVLGTDSHLREVTLAYLDGSKVIGAFGDPRLSGFQYRKPIAITGSTDPLFHYQVALAIGESADTAAYDVHCEGRARSDFADLRITGSDGQTILPHYLETIVGMSPARLAVVWVQVPQLPPEGLTLYLYYGNPSAPNLSDGAAVFDFFDEFEGGRLDPKAWEVQAGQGSARVADSKLRLAGASVLTKSFRLTDGIVEYLATTNTAQDDARLIIRSDPETTHPDETNQVAYASAYGGAEHVIAVGSIVQANDPKPIAPETPYGYQLVVRGTELAFQRYDAEFADVQATVVLDDAGGLTRGALGLHSEGGAAYDWIRVRRLALPPPTVAETGAGPEEPANLPVFTNTTVLPDGDLALADPKQEGSYQTAQILSEFAVRILVPQWQGDVLAMAISADGGESYRQPCQSGVHYYASKGHFTPGKRLMAQVKLAGSDEAPTPALQALSLEYTAGRLFVVSPNGGEELEAGTTHQIVWSAQGHDATYPVKLEYSLDGGKTYKLIADSTENDGAHVWVLPDDAASEDVLVKVADRNDTSLFDASDEPFSVMPAGSIAQQGDEDANAEKDGDDAAFSDDLLEMLDELSAEEGALPYELAIMLQNAGDGPLGYQAGDIVLIRPAGRTWSDAERSAFLIIQADLTPEAVAMLMKPMEAPTGHYAPDGRPIMRVIGRHHFKIDLSYFDLRPRAGDKGKPPVLRHFKKKADLRTLLEDRAEPPSPPAQPVPVDAAK